MLEVTTRTISFPWSLIGSRFMVHRFPSTVHCSPLTFTEKQRWRVVIASETKQSRSAAMRLPRTLRVLAMTATVLVFYPCFWASTASLLSWPGGLFQRAVLGPIAIIASQNPFHVLLRLREGDLLDELIVRPMPPRLHPPAHMVRSGVIRGQGQDPVAIELLEHLCEVSSPELDVRRRRFQVHALTASSSRIDDLIGRPGQKLHQPDGPSA